MDKSNKIFSYKLNSIQVIVEGGSYEIVYRDIYFRLSGILRF